MADAVTYLSTVQFAQSGCLGAVTHALVGPSASCTPNNGTCSGNTFTSCGSTYFDIPSSMARIVQFSTPTCDNGTLRSIEGFVLGVCRTAGPTQQTSYRCDANGNVLYNIYSSGFACSTTPTVVTYTAQCQGGNQGFCTPSTGGGGGGSAASTLCAATLLWFLVSLII